MEENKNKEGQLNIELDQELLKELTLIWQLSITLCQNLL